MELGKKIYQLRKLSGMTQEQLADKLSISRQTLSKWENGSSMPDVESVVKLSTLFHTSLEELLLEEENHVEEKEKRKETQITLEDMMRINAHNRRMNLLLSSGLLFLAIGIIIAAVERMLETTTVSLGYTLYRYIAVGQYAPLPVNYTRLMMPAVLAGAVGVILCLYCFMENKKDGYRKNGYRKKDLEKKQMKKQYIIGLGILILAAAIFLLIGAGRKEKPDNENLYGNIIAELGDEEQFSLRDIGEKNNVLFTTDMTYDDGNGHNAALYCNVYYDTGEEIFPLGQIESMGTAYPISYGKKCIYTASGHSLVKYQFDTKKKQWMVSVYGEVFDEDGNASYQYTHYADAQHMEDGKTETISEKDYLDAFEEYGNSTVVNFGYGASDNPY